MLTQYRLTFLLILGLTASPMARCAELGGSVFSDAGAPLEDAVVALYPGTAHDNPPPAPASMDQKNKTFVPRVLPVQRGSAVTIPNSDQIRHHVYSFSPAKRFELKLYQGNPPESVLFDTPGIAVLGCNIHDTMVGYIDVLDTPYFAKTDGSGAWRIKNLPKDHYRLEIWHPDARNGIKEEFDLTEQAPPAMRHVLELKLLRRITPSAPQDDDGYVP